MAMMLRCMTCGQAFRAGDTQLLVRLEVHHPAWADPEFEPGVVVNGVMHKACVSDLLQTVLTPWDTSARPMRPSPFEGDDQPVPGPEEGTDVVPEPGRPSI